MKKRVVAIVQARMGSKRLPGKVLQKIGDKTILELVCLRLKKSNLIDQIVIATSQSKKDDPIVDLAKYTGLSFYRGSEEDVLSRYAEAAEKFDANIIVRATADNPLTDPVLTDKLISEHLQRHSDYTYSPNAPLGLSVEVVNKSALEIVSKKAKSIVEKEHVTIFIKEHPGLFKIHTVPSDLYEGVRLTVDTAEDMKLMQELYKIFGDFEDLLTDEILAFLEKKPELTRLNSHIGQLNPLINLENDVKITVIMRTHNSEKFVEKAVNSALNQSLSNDHYEILVIDDASVDKTREILKKYSNKIRIIEMERLGPIKAINLGIRESLGEYLILLDSDDTFESNALKEFLQTIESTNVDFVYSDYYEKEVEKNENKLISIQNNLFNTVAGGIMFKKSVLEDLGGYDEHIFFPEYDLLIKLLKNKYKYEYIPLPLFTYYRHENSLTANQKAVEEGYDELFSRHGYIKGLRDY